MNSVVEDKQLKLEEHLKELSEDVLDGESIKESVAFFLDLYNSPDGELAFRHSYSSISLVVYGGTALSSHEDFNRAVKNAQIIASNLDQVVTEMERRACDVQVMRGMEKLSDHIRLEMQRLTTFESAYSGIESAIEGGLKSLNGTIEGQKAQLKEIKDEAEKNSEKARREYIAILGIFAAIVIAFMSGTAFSSSVLQNIDNASIYRLAFIILVLGLFLFNLLIALFAFLGEMTGNPLFKKEGWQVAIIAIVTDAVMLLLIGAVVCARFNNVIPPIY